MEIAFLHPQELTPASLGFPLWPSFLRCHDHFYYGSESACEAGYSDGSKAIDYAVEMYDYEDNLIAKEMTDKRSIVEFPNPDTEFYLVFDSGHEFPVEVDVVEISDK